MLSVGAWMKAASDDEVHAFREKHPRRQLERPAEAIADDGADVAGYDEDADEVAADDGGTQGEDVA